VIDPDPAPGAEMTDEVSRRFDPDLRSVGSARRFATETAHAWSVDAADIALVVGELAANAVLYGQTPFTVHLRRDQRVSIEVSDLGSSAVHPASPSPLSQRGRGLQIVDRVAVDWGIQPSPDGGKVVWAWLEP